MVPCWYFLAQFRTILFMFTNRHGKTARTILPLTFFGILVSMLVIGESLDTSQASTVTVQNGETTMAEGQEPIQKLPRCKEDSDCPMPTTYCGPSGKCAELIDPTCDCGQPQVLRCYDKNEKARFMFCKNGCITIENGAICQ